MNTLRLLLSIACFHVAGAALADDDIDVAQIPETVTAAVEKYFPGSVILSAEREKDDGRYEYELIIRYRDILLEVEVADDGRILDVDMEN